MAGVAIGMRCDLGLYTGLKCQVGQIPYPRWQARFKLGYVRGIQPISRASSGVSTIPPAFPFDVQGSGCGLFFYLPPLTEHPRVLYPLAIPCLLEGLAQFLSLGA